jgi:replicative superfamily II helicase
MNIMFFGTFVLYGSCSGGKTLVSEILMLRRLGLYCHGEKYHGSILYIVPFISLAEV